LAEGLKDRIWEPVKAITRRRAPPAVALRSRELPDFGGGGGGAGEAVPHV